MIHTSQLFQVSTKEGNCKKLVACRMTTPRNQESLKCEYECFCDVTGCKTLDVMLFLDQPMAGQYSTVICEVIATQIAEKTDDLNPQC